jgi:molybdenum cofactor guanylyltransferase
VSAGQGKKIRKCIRCLGCLQRTRRALGLRCEVNRILSAKIDSEWIMKRGNKDEPLIKDVTGVILAGGKSSRYGKNKSFVKVNGIPLIERVIRAMKDVFQDVIIITNTPNEYAYLTFPMFEDLIKGLGPLGGIYTGLKSLQTRTGFFVACDMPTISQKLIKYMVGNRYDHDIVVPRIAGRLEPLCALYSQSCLPPIKRLIDARQCQVFRFFDEVSVRYIEGEEIRRIDSGLRTFFNINRPEELNQFHEALRQERERRKGGREDVR